MKALRDHCPELQLLLVPQGRTQDDAMATIRDAISAYQEDVSEKAAARKEQLPVDEGDREGCQVELRESPSSRINAAMSRCPLPQCNPGV